jgi:hypothetical protein
MEGRHRLAEAIALRGEPAEPQRLPDPVAQRDRARFDAELAHQHHGELLRGDVHPAPGGTYVQDGARGREVDEQVVPLRLRPRGAGRDPLRWRADL